MTRTCTRATALALAILAGASPAGAQRSKPRSSSSSSSSILHSLTWSAGAGVSLPTGDLGNGAATGFHVQGASSYHRATWPIAIRGEVAYHHFGEKAYTVAGQRPGQTIAYTGK